MNRSLFQRFAHLIAVLAAAGSVASPVTVSIPAGDADLALKAFAEQTGINLVYSRQRVEGVSTAPVSGEMEPSEAMERMLQGTPLGYHTDDASGAIVILRKPMVSHETGEQPSGGHPAVGTAINPKHQDNKNMKPENALQRKLLGAIVGSVLSFFVPVVNGQTEADPTQSDEVYELSPFTVETDAQMGYMATSSLAGTRLRTELRDVGTSISVLTQEFLEDLGATDAMSILPYTMGFEVAGPRGNYLGAGSTGSFGNADETAAFLSPSTQTRVRGLVSADNTRNYFRTTVAWDSYNVNRIDLLRGPNSILFGLGSPGGVVNGTTETADLLRDSGRFQAVIDQYGTFRASLNYNKVVLKDELAVRIAALEDNKRFRQEEAYDDQNRYFLTAKWRPSFLNQVDGMFFEVTADFETGESDSNRPRNSPPADQITPFFQPVTINDIRLPEGSNYNGYANGIVPGAQLFVNGATIPYINNINKQVPLGVITSFDGNGLRQIVDNNPANSIWRVGRMSAIGTLNPNGSLYSGFPYNANQLYGVGYLDQILASVNLYANNIQHPFASAFSPLSLTDTSVFDYFNHLLDGPNKKEWSDFDQMRVAITNTFLDGMFGYEVSAYKEDHEQGQTTFLSDNNRIFIDINESTIEGTPNPNLGRAYVQETTFGGNRIINNELESYRISAFMDYDFRDHGESSWWKRILGRHVLNGVISEDKTFRDSRNFQRHVFGDDLIAYWGHPRFNNNTRVTLRYYLSDDLRGGPLSGANFSPLERNVIPSGGTVNVRVFDRTWVDPGIDPGAVWVNPLGQTVTQSDNPANYAGWTNQNFTIVDALSGDPADQDLATRDAGLLENTVDSQILTWQGYLFDGIVVGTVGYRKDESESILMNAPSRPDRGDDVSPDVYNLQNGTRFELETESKNYSLVAHVTRLPVLNRLPLDVSLTYNKGENFNPTAGRRDLLNRQLAPPQGETEEYGVLFSTRDGKYSLRVQRYETAVVNDTGPGLRLDFRLQQFYGAIGANMAVDVTSGELRTAYEALAEQPAWSIDEQENVHAPAWYAFEQAFAQQFPSFVDAWLTNGTYAPSGEDTAFAVFGPNGARTTQDTVSKGWEIELTANPTPSLRLALNATQTEALRDNVPGAAMTQVIEWTQDQMWNGNTPTSAGLLRAPDYQNDSMADWWLREVYSSYSLLQALNGQLNAELVEWRVNAVVNYTFLDGKLEGLGAGFAYRWESDAAIGYPYMFDQFGNAVANIADPFERDGEDQVDLWLRYKRTIFGLDATFQLNVANAFEDSSLVPISANPDGQVARWRIKDGRAWRFSAGFEF